MMRASSWKSFALSRDPADVGQQKPNKSVGVGRMSNRRLSREVAHLLSRREVDPVEFLERSRRRQGWRPGEFWSVVAFLSKSKSKRVDEAVQVFEWWKRQAGYRAREEHFVRLMVMAARAGFPRVAELVFEGMEAADVKPTAVSYSALVQSFAESGDVEASEAAMRRMLDAGLKPTVVTYGGLIRAFGKRGLFDEMAKVFNTMKTVHCEPDFFVYKNLIEAYSRGGLVARMESAFKAMLSDGWRPDAEILDEVAQGYAAMGMINEMERVHGELKRLKKHPSQETVRACALAYIRHNQFYQMEEFVRSLGMKRIGGTLLWNLLLLSKAANFAMKSLQREAVNMSAARCSPDLTTFNIRALAFSRMLMLWDLHVLVQHLKSLGMEGDVVTYGAVVDAYVAARCVHNLHEQLEELEMLERCPDVRTDPLVFEAFGRGRFHLFCDDFIQRKSTLTYSSLTTAYFETVATNKNKHKHLSLPTLR